MTDSSDRGAPTPPDDAIGLPAATGALALQLLLALLFYGVVTPVAVLLRALRVDVSGLRRDERARTYWRTRARRGAQERRAPS